MRGRPRIHNTHLPPGVFRSHGAYYVVKRGSWLHLGRTEAEALARLRDTPITAAEAEILKFATLLVARTRQNCKKRRQLDFALTTADIKPLLDAAGWRCAVTRTPFSLEFVGKHRPYAPSIDRIDNARGYTRDNCRIVCSAVNIAMNVWGVEVLRRIAQHMRKAA